MTLSDPFNLDAFLAHVHGQGCESTVKRDRGTGEFVRVFVDAADGTRYSVERDELRAFMDAGEVARWQIPEVCQSCERADLRAGRELLGATARYPYCGGCWATANAEEHMHADVLAAFARRGLVCYIEQTGGGCKNLRAHRAYPDALKPEFSYPEPGDSFGPSIIAVAAMLDAEEGWDAADASIPQAGCPWAAWAMLRASDVTGETWPESPVVPLNAHALAAFADSILPPVGAPLAVVPEHATN